MSRQACLALALTLGLVALPSAAPAATTIAQIDAECTQIDVAKEVGSWSKVPRDAAGDWRLSGKIGDTQVDESWTAASWFEGNALVEEIKHQGAIAHRSLTGAGVSIWASSGGCQSIKGSFDVSGDWAERKMEGGELAVNLEYFRYEPPSGCKGAGRTCDPATDCCPGNTACPSTGKCPD